MNQSELKKFLKNAKQIAILGVGSELRGDDSAGLLVARHIQDNFKNSHSQLKIFFGFTAPENLTGEIKEFKPTHLIIIDAADMGIKPGKAVLLKPCQLKGISFSTHQLPLNILTDYLSKTLRCKIIIIAIQPKKLNFIKPISSIIAKNAQATAQAIEKGVRVIFE
jgi:hydrogenase 3 maturation protease